MYDPMQIGIDCTAHARERKIEIVERKGLGHPDTICDHVSERFSVALSRYYLKHFGLVLHHNVDKVLLSAGRSEPAFGSGRIVRPIELFLSGRATSEFKGVPVPVEDIAREAAEAWFHDNMHAFNVTRGLTPHCLTQPGSLDLVDLFVRQRDKGVFLSNDTSIGVGYAPFSELENIVLAVERHVNAPAFKAAHPETGEDVKVMGLREHKRISLILSCAFIGRYLAGLDAYRDAVERLASASRNIALGLTECEVKVRVNAADILEQGSVYLTVGGTSAECGDDGEAGRGNRPSGLITPFRPMTMEATAGKNPITHVGKLYNAAAFRIARRIVAEQAEILSCECHLVSEIGRPIHEPRLTHVGVCTADAGLSLELERKVRDCAASEIAGVPNLWREFLDGIVVYV